MSSGPTDRPSPRPETAYGQCKGGWVDFDGTNRSDLPTLTRDADQSAARFSSAGIEPFGCLKSLPPLDGVGAAFGR